MDVPNLGCYSLAVRRINVRRGLPPPSHRLRRTYVGFTPLPISTPSTTHYALELQGYSEVMKGNGKYGKFIRP
jgi:hypothetical protein